MEPGESHPQEPEPPSRSTNALDVIVDDPSALLTQSDLRALRERTARLAVHFTETGSVGEVRVALVNDESMSALHQEYLDDPSTTDVITFDMRESLGDPLDTDAFVCVDEARRIASERSHDPLDELALYILHAILHCVGEDDTTLESADQMRKRQDEIMTACGMPALSAVDILEREVTK